MSDNWDTERSGKLIVNCHSVREVKWNPVGCFDGYYRDAGVSGRKVELKSSKKLFRGSQFISLTNNQYQSAEDFDLYIASGCSGPLCPAAPHEVSMITSELLRKIEPDDETITRYWYYKTIKDLYERGLIPCSTTR